MADEVDNYGGNRPMYAEPAKWDGHRSIRLSDGGLATTTYSYSMSYQERAEAALRISVLWNLHLGVPTQELEQQLEARASI